VANIDCSIIDDIKEVLSFGASKGYGYDSWREGKKPCNQHLAKAIGHLAKSMAAEFDGESGLPHLQHALCRVAMAWTNYKTEREV